VTYLWVAIGGALGSMARFWMTLAVASFTGPRFPWGTLAINIIGSFAIGWFGSFTGVDGRFSMPADARIFVMTGICGGYTTFSAFSLQTLELLQAGEIAAASFYAVGSVALCLLGVWAGVMVAKL
jgi:fluoride exporter